MSKEQTEKNKGVKVVRINESQLVDMLENILNQAVEVKKEEWIAESKTAKENLLEDRIAKLEKMIAESKEDK